MRRRSVPARGAIGWDELPWIKFPIQPRRQFLRFVETVRELGCDEDEAGFEQLLARLGTRRHNRMPENTGSVSGVKRTHAFAGPAGGDLEHAAA